MRCKAELAMINDPSCCPKLFVINSKEAAVVRVAELSVFEFEVKRVEKWMHPLTDRFVETEACGVESS